MEKAEGDVVASDFAEDVHEVAGSDEAGGEVPSAVFDVFDKEVGGLLGSGGFEEIESESEDVARLGFAFDVASIGDIGFIECGFDFVGEIVVGFGVFCFSEDFGGVRDDAGGAGKVGGVDDVVRGVCVDAHPVSEAVIFVGRKEVGFGAVFTEINELFHAWIRAG